MYIYKQDIPIMTTKGIHRAKSGDEVRDLPIETIKDYIERGIIVNTQEKSVPDTKEPTPGRAGKGIFSRGFYNRYFTKNKGDAPENKEG